MSTVFFILLALAAFHFVYESILAPSFRLSLRFKLFKLRDEVRQLKIDCAGSLMDKHFEFLQDSINAQIAALPRIDLALFIGSELEARRDPDFMKCAESRAVMLDDCQIPCAREIRYRTLKVVAEALIANSGTWVVLLFAPFVIALIGYQEAKKRFKVIASLSGQEFKRIAPLDGTLSAK